MGEEGASTQPTGVVKHCAYLGAGLIFAQKETKFWQSKMSDKGKKEIWGRILRYRGT